MNYEEKMLANALATIERQKAELARLEAERNAQHAMIAGLRDYVDGLESQLAEAKLEAEGLP